MTPADREAIAARHVRAPAYPGDCRAVMAEMEPGSVHCVVTSPPYGETTP